MSRRRRALSLALVVLVVASTVPAGPVGTAAANPWADCSGLAENPEALYIGLIGAFSNCHLNLGSGTVADNLTGLDANETKSELYGSLSSVSEQSQNGNVSMRNKLTMTKSIARMEAKNAYIRALNNSSSEASARLEADRALNNFTAVQQAELLNRWEVQMQEFKRAHGHASEATGVSASSFLRPTFDASGVDYWVEIWQSWSFGTETITLANGSTMNVTTLTGHYEAGQTSGGSYIGAQESVTIRPTDRIAKDGVGIRTASLDVATPYAGDGLSSFEYLSLSPNGYGAQWHQIKQQRQEVDANVNDYINGTYDQWEAGKIDTSDLIDPYVAAREHSPSEDFQAWALMSLQMTGSNTVGNMSNFGHMAVTDLETGNQYTGIAMSDGVPAGGQFEANSTYNASQIDGPQYVVTNSSIETLNGEFRVGKMETADGEVIQNVTYTNITYKTNDLSGYKQRIETLNDQIAEINARQDKLRGTIGGGLWGGSVPPEVALGAIGVVVLLVVLGKEG